jgi:hypothetical protein
VQDAALDAAREERRHAVEVGREDERRLTHGRDDVDAIAGHGLLEHRIAAAAQVLREHTRHRPFLPGRGLDVDERGARPTASTDPLLELRARVGLVVAFTMTGVASKAPSPCRRPLTERAPGTTIALRESRGLPPARIRHRQIVTGVEPVRRAGGDDRAPLHDCAS